MSNLASKFDVLRGWPFGGAIEHNMTVAASTTVKEGMFVAMDSSGNAALPSAIAAQGAATGPTKLRMVIQGNDQFDGSFLNKCTTLRGNFSIATDKFVAGTYTKGQLVTIDVSANKGYITARTASNEQVVGEVEDYDSTNGILTVSVSI